MTPLQALIDARALLAEPERWTQGDYAKSKRGRPIGPNAPGAACWCAVGALKRVAAPRHAFSAGYVLSGVVNDGVLSWNDAPERTHAEVLAAFDAAIARLQEATE